MGYKPQKLESQFKTHLTRRIKKEFPGSMIFHLNPMVDGQGIPDLLVLYEDKWVALEGKQSIRSKRRPNQEFYVNKMDKMSMARFVYPQNEEEVLNDISTAFGVPRKTF